MHGHIGEGRRWLQACLAAPGSLSTPYRSRALTGAGLLAYAQADFAVAVELLEESLRLARERHDVQALAWALHGLGRVRHSAGDLEHADADLEESLNLFRELDDAAGCAYTLYFVARQARVRGDYVQAAELYAEALAPAQEIGDVWILGWILTHSADLAFVRGELEQAATLYRQSLALLHQIRATWPISVCLFGLTGLAGAQGQPQRAARLFGAEQTLRVELGTTTEYLDLGPYEAGLAAARDALGGVRFDALAQAGKAMTLDEVVAFALAVDGPAERAAPRSSTGVQSPSSPSLTTREQEVARLIARGMHNREIAAALVITPRTTDTHVMNILTKLGLHTRAQIAAWAVEHRILAEDT
jgi:non-specific serine/threonine protein kinase